MPLSLDEIRAHWQGWAQSYGTDLRATTRTSTAKVLEVAALERTLRRFAGVTGRPLSVLEAGCGNGHNCLHLAAAFPEWHLSGFDYVPEMVEAAEQARSTSGIDARRLHFFQDDVTTLAHTEGIFDAVMTVRCLINLNTPDLQFTAIERLSRRVAPGGLLLMIENSQLSYAHQNRARELVGLPPRTPASFNLFFDETTLMPHLDAIGFDVVTEDISSLHDLVLYVLVPLVNGGTVDYAHPMVEAATQLNRMLDSDQPGSLGAFGQNRMFICRKRLA